MELVPHHIDTFGFQVGGPIEEMSGIGSLLPAVEDGLYVGGVIIVNFHVAKVTNSVG